MPCTICCVDTLKRLPYLFSFLGGRDSWLTNMHSSHGGWYKSVRVSPFDCDWVKREPELQLHLLRGEKAIGGISAASFLFPKKCLKRIFSSSLGSWPWSLELLSLRVNPTPQRCKNKIFDVTAKPVKVL